VTVHEYSCHVRFSDVDVYGHVNNVLYFEYFQEARLAFLTAIGYRGRGPGGLVVAHVRVDYRRPIVLRTEPYVVTTTVTRVGSSSFELASRIVDGPGPGPGPGSGLGYADARSVMVGFDPATQSSRPLSDHEREVLTGRLDEKLSPPRRS
jgi:acyl-CoA thioester hydrolase